MINNIHDHSYTGDLQALSISKGRNIIGFESIHVPFRLY